MKKILLLLIFLGQSITAQLTFEPVTNPPEAQIKIFILSQGFTTAEMNNFHVFANELINKIQTTEPFSNYQNYIKFVKVIAPATISSYPRAFNQFPGLGTSTSNYGCPGNANVDEGCDPLINECDIDYNAFVTRMDNLVATFNGINPSYNYDNKSYLIAVFNNLFYSGGGGKYTFVTNRQSCTYAPPQLMQEVAIHEFGHSFGLLGDEYSNTSTVSPDDFPLFHDRNVTEYFNQSELPWANFITQTPMPECSFGSPCNNVTGIGRFEGAMYSQFGWFRSEENCKMNDITDSFCTTCRNLIKEVIIKHICFPDPTVNINENFILNHQYITHWRKASQNLTSTSTIGEKISVNFVSNNTIVLTSGFHARQDSDFWAYIGDCNSIDVRNEYRIISEIGTTPPQPSQKLDSSSKQQYLTIHPNPVNNGILEITTNIIGIKDIIIYDFTGKIVFNERSENALIKLNSLSKGVYIIKVTQDNYVKVEKLIIE